MTPNLDLPEKPLVELTLTIAPRDSIKYGIAARASRKGPVRLIRSVESQPSGVSSRTGALAPTPWLQTSASRRPKALAAPSIAPSAPSGVPTSAGTVTALPPLAVISSATCSSGYGRRPTRATPYPFSAKSRAVARPMPVPAPVTTTDRDSCAIRSLLLPDASSTQGIQSMRDVAGPAGGINGKPVAAADRR